MAQGFLRGKKQGGTSRVLLVCLLFVSLELRSAYDLTIVGFHRFSWGIGRRPIALIHALSDSLTLNYITTRPKPSSEKDIPESVLKILTHPDKSPGKVAFFVDILAYKGNLLAHLVPESQLKLAFVTLEMTKAPASWVYSLNSYFDAVIVPDRWLVDVLGQSGTEIPIFVLPELCFLQDFLKKPLRYEPHTPFVFGISAQVSNNKNFPLLLNAFAQEFGSTQDVVLKIQTSWDRNARTLSSFVKNLRLKNVIIHTGPLCWDDYINHMDAIDCYVLCSRGEGFSITPREALALGRPCILSENTAHRTLCATGFVRPVRSTILLPHDGENYDEPCGYQFESTVEDLRAALRDVYDNYQQYLAKAHRGRDWVARYDISQLKEYYRSLCAPQQILLGSHNEVGREYLMTSSRTLYTKYKTIALSSSGQP